MDHRKSIDHLKAFAIILVVFYHAMFQVHASYSCLTNTCVTIALRDIHVPLFILIAGYLCHRQDIMGFLRKKARRILIPFLFFTVLKLIMNNLMGTEYVHGDTFPKQLWDAFICGQLYWFCYCLLIMFLIAPLLWDRKVLQWILFGAALTANILLAWFEVELTDILQLKNVLYYSTYFLLGMLLSGYRFPGFFRSSGRDNKSKRGKSRGIWICSMIAAAGTLGTGYLRFIADSGDRVYIVDYVFGICVMYLLYLLTYLTVRNGISDRILQALGRDSLQIMLLDPFWRVLAYELFRHIIPDGMLLAAIITPLVLALSWATCLIFRRIPGLSFLSGLESRKVN